MANNEQMMVLHIGEPIDLVLDGKRVTALPGDVIVDRPGGKRELIHGIDFELLQQQGWQNCDQSGKWELWEKGGCD
jgi:signal peptidase I